MNLVGRSFGRCLSNRLLSGWSMWFTTRPFGCALRRAQYWELWRRIPSLTDGISRSLRITIFGTHQGASTIMRKAFDWKRSWIYMLKGEAIPQSCIPQVQIGLSIVLYMRSLLFVESFDFRPSNQYILVRVIPNCFRFAKICLCQVSLLPRDTWHQRKRVLFRRIINMEPGYFS
jgi:hypothetical protein